MAYLKLYFSFPWGFKIYCILVLISICQSWEQRNFNDDVIIVDECPILLYRLKADEKKTAAADPYDVPTDEEDNG